MRRSRRTISFLPVERVGTFPVLQHFAGSHLAVVLMVRMESRRIRFYRTFYVVDFIEYFIWKKKFLCRFYRRIIVSNSVTQVNLLYVRGMIIIIIPLKGGIEIYR